MTTESGKTPIDRDAVGKKLPGAGEDGLPKNWHQALASLLLSRTKIIRIEAQSAFADAAGRLVLLLVGVFGIFCAWLLALAASIGAIAAASSWEWYHIAFVSAGAHFLIGVILLLIMKSRKQSSFPVTRAEFEKDRKWLSRLK